MLLTGVLAATLAVSATPATADEFRLRAPCALVPAAGSDAVAPSQPSECLFAGERLRAALFPPDPDKPHARVIVFEWDATLDRPRPTKALHLPAAGVGAQPLVAFGRMDASMWAWVRSQIGADAPARPPSAPPQLAEPPAVAAARAQGIAVRSQYDHLGRLILKIGNEGSRQYLYDDDSRRVLRELDEHGNVVALYSWAGDDLNSITRPGLGTFYPVTDSLGSIVALTDDAGEVVARFQYDAWGNIRSATETVPAISSYRYAGQRWQEEVGLYDAGARYYAPDVGRFTTPDSYLGKIEDPASRHRYTYASANPARYVDPDGHQSSDSRAFQRELLAARARTACEADPSACAAQRVSEAAARVSADSQAGHALGAGLRGGGAVALALTPEPTLLTKLAAGYLALTAGDDAGTLGRALLSREPEKTARAIALEEGLRAIDPDDVEQRAATMQALVDMLLPMAGGPKGALGPSAFESGRVPVPIPGGPTPSITPPSSGLWAETPTTRGVLTEQQLAGTEYKDWYHVGAEANGQFPLVDFQKGNNLVSLKTVDTAGKSWMGDMQRHIQDLSTRGATVSGERAKMILDLRVQPGGLVAAQPLVDYGKSFSVNVIIKEIR